MFNISRGNLFRCKRQHAAKCFLKGYRLTLITSGLVVTVDPIVAYIHNVDYFSFGLRRMIKPWVNKCIGQEFLINYWSHWSKNNYSLSFRFFKYVLNNCWLKKKQFGDIFKLPLAIFHNFNVKWLWTLNEKTIDTCHWSFCPRWVDVCRGDFKPLLCIMFSLRTTESVILDLWSPEAPSERWQLSLADLTNSHWCKAQP